MTDEQKADIAAHLRKAKCPLCGGKTFEVRGTLKISTADMMYGSSAQAHFFDVRCKCGLVLILDPDKVQGGQT
jgi:hypothetical protein